MVSQHDVETVVINLLSARAELSGIDVLHSTRGGAPSGNEIWVKATRGDKVLEGPEGFIYSVEISVGLGIVRTGDVTGWDDVIRVIDAEMTSPTGDGDAGDFFTYFEIREDQETEKEAKPKELRRTAQYLIHAVGV